MGTTAAVFLILYFWHGEIAVKQNPHDDVLSLAATPVMQVLPMPTLAACEVVGAAAKQLIDAAAPGNEPDRTLPRVSRPAQFRCVAVSR